MKKSLFIFRRDLRLDDNTGLLFALENSEIVIPCFIFTPEQIEKNPYRSNHCLRFMIESLKDLEEQLERKGAHLFLFFDSPEKIVEKCIDSLSIDGVIVNRDYTPYSQRRDAKIETVCKKKKIPFHSFDDALLQKPEETLKADGKPYAIFTPFYRNASHLKVRKPQKNNHSNYDTKKIPFAESKQLYQKLLPDTKKGAIEGGRACALKILRSLKNYAHYKKIRDIPSEDGTTHLSPHLKFTTCSPREIFWAIREELGPQSELLRSLYWRDFFSSIAFHFPHVFEGAFHKKWDKLHWSYDKKAFKHWCEGTTGFPIVDAGMREMNETGFMQNRVRMIAASFLVKDLHIDWRWGEKYFAQTLIDYDPAVNNGNWQWSASTGCDAQPYFRIFNPWTQQEKFDPECLYIKRWIPELKKVPIKEIHQWYKKESEDKSIDYPLPIVDHGEESKIALKSYKTIYTNDQK